MKTTGSSAISRKQEGAKDVEVHQSPTPSGDTINKPNMMHGTPRCMRSVCSLYSCFLFINDIEVITNIFWFILLVNESLYFQG